MTHHLYNLLLTLLLILLIPYFLLRSLVQRDFRKGLAERMGFLPNLSGERPIWVHAASVGEVFCSVPLLKRIKREFPSREIVLTTMTPTGNQAAKRHVLEADHVFLLPMDHPFTIQRAIRRVEPSLLLIAETELWPNLLFFFGKKGIPIILFNGRISRNSFRRYLRFKFFFRECLKPISLFLMQTEEDCTRIIEIGAPSEKTAVMGNLKFDQTFPPVTQEEVVEMGKSLGLRGEENVLIAGSTHTGEEEILLSLYKELRGGDPDLVLILAPRHLNRLDEVEKLLKREEILYMRKTSLSFAKGRSNQGERSPQVILLDTMGELMRLYSLGTLIFIGGSLVPVGGHNPLEPLFFSRCVLFGPHMFNFSEIARSLTEAGGAIQVEGRKDFSYHVKRLLSDERARNEVGERGHQFLERHRGAADRIFRKIRPFIEESSKLKGQSSKG